jgi:exodeoxyribonuclease (lambda-induced)
MIKFHNLEQRTPEWLNMRLGRTGGSEAIGLTTKARMDTLIFKKMAEILTGNVDEIKPSESMLRGIDLEPIAVEKYELEEMAVTTEVGYITNDKYKYLGLSPDRIVGGLGGLEVKCPGSKEHVKTIIEGVVPKKHEPQIAMYFFVNEFLEWVDFVSYDDRVKAKPYFKITVTREEFAKQIKVVADGYKKYEEKMVEYLKLF